MASYREPSSADDCYARLIEMFGEGVEMDKIYDIGTSCHWNFSQCVEALLKCPDRNQPLRVQPLSSSSSLNADTPPTTEQLQMSFAERLQLGLGATAFTDPAKESSDRNSHLDKLYYQISDGYKILVLMRGLPGSGKSSLARQLLQRASLDPAQHLVSADDYFTDRFGNYNYDRAKISEAHRDCQNRVNAMMIRNFAPIIVDNTNIRLWEMEAFCVNAVDHGYIVQILEPTTYWAKNSEECMRRNCHGVPFDTIINMKRTYERIQNGQELLDHFHLPKRIQYQLREQPPIVRTPELEPEPDVIKSFSPIESTDDFVIDSEEIVKSNPFENFNWTAHEREVSSFWAENILPAEGTSAAKSGQTHSMPKTQREKVETDADSVNKSLFDQMLSALKDPKDGTLGMAEKESPTESTKPLSKHRKGCLNENESFSDVRQAFPTISIQYLWELFEKCNGDANWMMNILLNETTEIDDIPGNNEEDFDCPCELSDEQRAIADAAAVAIETSREQRTGRTPLPHRQQKKKMFNQRVFDQEAEQMKRQIEESVCIGDQFYSENMKRVREWKAKKRGPDEQRQQLSEGSEGSSTACVTVDAVAGDEEEDDFEEDVFEFRLGSEFINQLEGMFNTNSDGLDFHKFRPNVYMPTSLAKQIYHLWVESMMYQLEEQKLDALKDDEEIARQINQLEEKRTAVNFSDVTQMACAMQAYRPSCKNAWSNDNTDLAVKLKRQKLYEIFPKIPKDTVDEILRQNNDNYDRVVETLTNSYNPQERLLEQQNKLILAAKFESEKVSKQSTSNVLQKPFSGSGDAKRDALKDFEENRNKAMHHYQFRMECNQKAREASQKRNSEVAYYYLQVGKLHQQQLDYYNHLAANYIVEVHDLTHNNAELLDLHYLLVQEAIPCLEVFLDSHIVRLRRHKLPYKHIFLITGRGLHSAGGIPTIKMNVKNYLAKRGLRCIEMNPGLLRVKIYNNSRTTEQVN